jgi:tripartite-type tricarboxylate transporter receptor subunit TctC
MALAIGLGLFGTAASAQEDWPTRAVTIIVPYAPGAANDTFARAVAGILSDRFGKPFVVENRPGASGYTGALEGARAEPDGYTFLEAPNAVVSFQSVLDYDLDAVTDLEPIAMFAHAPVTLVAPTTLPTGSLEEYIAYLKERPGETFFGIVGLGSMTRMMTEQFVVSAGLDMTRVNYASATDGILDLVAGRIQLMFQSSASVVGQVEGGQLAILAYTSDSFPGETPPNAKSFAEAGIEGTFTDTWWGLFAPKGVPEDILDKMNAAVNEALSDPKMSELFFNSGATADPLTRAQFADAIVLEADALVNMKDELGIELK